MPVILFAICWLFGLWVATTAAGQAVGLTAWAIAASLSLLLAVVLRQRDPRASMMLGCLMLFAWGGVRMGVQQEQQCVQPQVCAFNELPRSVTLTGRVVAEPDVRDQGVNLRVAVDSITYRNLENPDGVTELVEGEILVRALRFPVFEYGMDLTLSGKLTTPFESAEFSYRELLAREGIYSSMYLPRIDIVATEQGNWLIAELLRFKAQLAASIDRGVPAPQSGLLNAVLLGDKSDLPRGLQDDFRTVGLSHLIAISGFHVAILMMVVVKIADAFVRPRPALLMTVVVLVLYALLVGGRVSVWRAVFMGVAYLIASRELGQRNATVGVLASAAVVLTLVNPLWLWSVGFQLSFAATLGIALFARPIEGWLRTQTVRVVSLAFVEGGFGRILSILTVTLAAQLTTLPLVGWHFGEISLISFVANLLVVAVQPLVMLLGGVAALSGLLIEPLGRLLGWIAWLPLSYTIEVVELLARVPWASVPVRITLFSLLVLYAAIGLGGWYSQQAAAQRTAIWQRLMVNVSQRLVAGTTGMATVLVLLWSGSQPDGKLHVTFFDVGQGDATLIVTPSGRQILIDGGHFPAVLNAHLGRTIPFWDRDIDMVIATHPDADHVTGLPEVFERYAVGQFIYDGNLDGTSVLYDAVLEQVALHAVPSRTVQAGEAIVIEDGVRLEVVHPGDALDDEIRNNNSVSLRLLYGEFSLLLSGDAERAAEREMVQRGLPLASLVYKVGHHGSDTSSTQAFLEEVRPKIAVVSAGQDNKFGHPHAEVLARLEAMNVAILTTSELGTISVATDGQTMWWTAQK